VDRAALVAVVVYSGWIFDGLDSSQFARLLVVFDAFSDLQVEGPAQCIGQMGEKLRLENTGE
jgi:hypothetical protein